MRTSRLAGVLVTGGLLLVVVILLRPAADQHPAEGVARGGELIAAIQSAPVTFNPYIASDEVSELIGQLTQARLVRVNPSTFEVEPGLAQKWEWSSDGRSVTLHLRPGMTWSDGAAFSSADVLFSLRAVYEPKMQSPLAARVVVGGQHLRASAKDASTVVVSFAAPSGPGLRLLDGLPILPAHMLEAALSAGTLASAWGTDSPRAIVGMGPFVLSDYQAGQRVVLVRNARYWRTAVDGSALPYLDRIVLRVMPNHDAELSALTSGSIDLLSSPLRLEDYVPARRFEEQGKLRLIEVGVEPSADAFWFCLSPDARRADPRFAFVQRPEFRQAISHAVDREAFAETVFRGSAVPVWGPTTPGNAEWFSPNLPRYAPDDVRARELLKGLGLEDRNGNGVVEDSKGVEARFSVITENGIESYEVGVAVLREELGRVGIALDVEPLDAAQVRARMLSCDYDAMYYRRPVAYLDPALNLDFWLSSGSEHVWNRGQRTPSTDWERRIDTLILEQAATVDPERRRQQFDAVQRILAENLPILYFAAQRPYYAHTPRVQGVIPSVLRPFVLWNADTLSLAR